MRARGLSLYGYRNQLKGWIDLSIQKNIPISLLIMSRAFVIQSTSPEHVIRDSLSSLDDDIINEVIVESARAEEQNSTEMRQRRLESIEFQQEVNYPVP
jgi:LETM1 and EF-hand domain-containing protein 1